MKLRRSAVCVKQIIRIDIHVVVLVVVLITIIIVVVTIIASPLATSLNYTSTVVCVFSVQASIVPAYKRRLCHAALVYLEAPLNNLTANR